MRRSMSSRLLSLASVVFAAMLASPAQSQAQGVTIYEGARLIVGDGTAIENSAFVVQGNQFAQVGRRGEVQAPAGAARVDLTGKTVMPTLVDAHTHLGYQNLARGMMSKEMFTRANLIDHLQRLAYWGVGAVVGVGDLVDRSDMKGGRTGWGDVPLKLRDEVVPNTPLYKTAGAGMAWPGSGAQGNPSRTDVAYPVTTPEEARAAVRDYVRMRPEFIKIWVDDREGTKMTLTPPLYLAVLDEAHRNNVPVGVHNVTLANAKQMMRAGMEGWLHVPVRGHDSVDDELIAIVRDRIARNDRPVIWMTPSLISSYMNTFGGPNRPAWLDDPGLTATYSREQIEEYWGAPLRRMTPAQVTQAKEAFAHDGRNAVRLRDAGMKIVSGSDTGQTRHLIGFANHMDLEGWVAFGLTPMQAIVGATRDGAAVGKFNNGMVASGRNADFIVLDANPLENISNTRKINRVYLRGSELPRAQFAARWQTAWRAAAAAK
jgi:imidazolonepropionase-like amidohydrolase